jgi:hypothetical protein
MEIMMMCGHAQDLVLMGDGFESDLFIYTIFQRILSKKADPHHLWRMVLSRKEFNLTSNQQATFLLKVYELTARLASRPAINVKIHIRCKVNMINEIYQKDLGDKELNKLKELVHFYEN